MNDTAERLDATEEENKGWRERNQRGPRFEEMVAKEKSRQFENMKKMLLETLSVLYRDYKITAFRYFRRTVEDAETMEELVMAKSLIEVVSKFHDATR